jgi:hypothetical protein
MSGFMDGIAAQTPALRSQLQGITGSIPGMTADVTPAGVRRTAAAGRELTLKWVGSEDDFNRFMRRSVVVNGGGSVQRAYGQGG